MIDGLVIEKLIKRVDERGFFCELIRNDWNDLIDGDEIVQFNLSTSYPNIVRAWHRHLRGQVDYFYCIKGAVKVCAYDDRPDSPTFGELDEFILSEENLICVRIPGILWHGYKAIGNETVKVLYAVNKLFNREDPDEDRRPWNDQTLIPKSINGNPNDPRVGDPWDWYRSPNK
jgi:dTDP-4-dehydrorhamnose 3,5-epimerase